MEATRAAQITVHAAAGLACGHVAGLRLLRAAEGLCRSAVAVFEANNGDTVLKTGNHRGARGTAGA